ncbi:MAG: DUF2085 domain-containing protein [Chloroflexi bacterium]|nr:DUF2085 domain-containing protein [Chloroflexota bacterium]
MTQTAVTGRTRSVVLAIDRLANWLARHWLALFVVIYGAYVLTPFTAPVLMQVGDTGAARGIYTAYSLVCHQLPERSIFFFGPKPMYSYQEIKAVWPEDGFFGLRQFIGNADFGYKMAWSDRMISFYGSIWVGALIFAALRRRVRPLAPIAWFLLGIVPVGLDGLSHMVNDAVAGTSGLGFRDTNAWLAFLTGNVFPSWFYVGDALGSFNSDMRWITGILFGLTTVWFIFPMIEAGMQDVLRQSEHQLQRDSGIPAAE